ncbi:MAG TPA: hypothetical protein VFP87_09935, partial [Chitinophagaceae bacterium]|nr:hypothetical protein [Chitinophagaceae bacterium]
METTIKGDPTLQSAPASRLAGIFGNNIPASVAYLAAILLFLLPFAEVRCNGNTLAHNSGLGIAMGSEWKEDVTKKVFGNSIEINEKEGKEYNQNQKPNVFAIVALALGIIGLVIAISAFRRGSNINFYIALLAAASLVGMLIQLRSKVRSDSSVRSSDLDVDV